MSYVSERAAEAVKSLKITVDEPATELDESVQGLVARSVLAAEFPAAEWLKVGESPGFVYVREADSDLTFAIRTNAAAAVYLVEPNPQTGGFTRVSRFLGAAQLGLVLADRKRR